MQKRKITKSAVANIFRFVSANKPDPIVVESYNEFIACHYFEFSPKVVNFEAQPQRFVFPLENRSQPLIYSPDFFVQLHDQQEAFFEIKPFATMLTEKFRHKWELLQHEFSARGLNLELVTDRQLMRGQMAENLKLIHRYMTRDSIEPIQKSILKLLADAPLSVRNLSEQLQCHENFTTAQLLNLVAKKHLSFPVYAELNLDTVFRRIHDE